MKIRIIDLLNKIANGEEVPEEIKFKNNIYEYRGDDYSCIFQNSKELWLFSDGYTNKTMWLGEFLNNEVEIIEEDKKIEFENIEEFKEYKLINTKDILELEMIINKINAEYNYKINVLIQNQKKLIDVINNLKGSDD